MLVVGIVVAGRKRVSAEHDAALDLLTEPKLASFLQSLPYIVGISIGIAVFDSIVTGKIGACLGWGNDIVNGNPILCVWQRSFTNLRSQLAQFFNVITYSLDDPWLCALYPVFYWYANTQTFDRAVQ